MATALNDSLVIDALDGRQSYPQAVSDIESDLSVGHPDKDNERLLASIGGDRELAQILARAERVVRQAVETDFSGGDSSSDHQLREIQTVKSRVVDTELGGGSSRSPPVAPGISVDYERKGVGRSDSRNHEATVVTGGKFCTSKRPLSSEAVSVVDVVESMTKYRDRTSGLSSSEFSASETSLAKPAKHLLHAARPAQGDHIASLHQPTSSNRLPQSHHRSQQLEIFRFKEEGKPADVRKKLASRRDKPVSGKRMILPKYVSNTNSSVNSSEKRDSHQEKKQVGGGNIGINSDAITASVAASAAVAATQPYIQGQRDLEQQVNQLNAKLAELDRLGRLCADLNPAESQAVAQLSMAERDLALVWADLPHLPPPPPPPPPPHHHHHHHGHHHHGHHSPLLHRSCEMLESGPVKEDGIYASRHIDQVERMQKQQMALQNRILTLTKRIGDQTTSEEETKKPAEPTAHPVTLVARGKNGKRNSIKDTPESPFLKKLLRQEEAEIEAQKVEAPVQSFPTAGTSQTKELTDEINKLRKDFKNQLNEIKRSMQKAYQPVFHNPPPEPLPAHHVVQAPIKVPELFQHQQEFPLDKYLMMEAPPPPPCPGPHNHHAHHATPHLSPIVRAMTAVPGPEMLDAEAILEEVTLRRCNLENNLTAIQRTREGQIIYSLIDLLQKDELSIEKARVKAMVDDAIEAQSKTVHSDVARDWQRECEQRQKPLSTAAPTTTKPRKPFVGRPTSRPVSTGPPKCGKFRLVEAKIDSGIRRPASTGPEQDRRVSPERQQSRLWYRDVSPSLATTNRRTVRTPYLHFVNEVKPAKKSVAHLQELKIMPLSSPGHTSPSRKPGRQGPSVHFDDQRKSSHYRYHRHHHQQNRIIPLGMRQYSMNYSDRPIVEDVPSVLNETFELASVETQTKPSMKQPETENVGQQTSLLVSPKDVKPKEDHVVNDVRASSNLSEVGSGLQLPGDYQPPRRIHDPLELVMNNCIEDEVLARVLTKFARRRTTEPDAGEPGETEAQALRELIEDALEREIAKLAQPPVEPPQIVNQLVRTPDGSEVVSRPTTPDYTEEFGSDVSAVQPEQVGRPANNTLAEDDRHLSSRYDVATPASSLASEEADFDGIRTPEPSRRTPVVFKNDHAVMQDSFVQTVCETGAQTDRQVTPPPQGPVYREIVHVEEVEEEEPSSTGSALSETPPNSFSEGQWLLDRSEGQAPDVFCQTERRIQLGPLPQGEARESKECSLTVDQRTEHSGDRSEGEFRLPTGHGLPADLDPVLNLLSSHGVTRHYLYRDYDENHGFIGGASCDVIGSMEFERLIGGTRPPRRQQRKVRGDKQHRSGGTMKSEGEVTNIQATLDFEEDDIEEIREDRTPQGHHKHSSSSPAGSFEKSRSHRVIHVAQSMDSMSGDFRETVGASMGTHAQSMSELDSHRSHTPNRRQFSPGHPGAFAGNVNTSQPFTGSASEFSDTATGTGMLSTNQIVMDALRQTGGTTMDFSGAGYIPTSPTVTAGQPKKLQVTVPGLDTVESDPTNPEFSDNSMP